MTTATTPTIADVLADIDRRESALGDPGDVLNTPNAQAEYYAKRSTLWNWRRDITTNAATLKQVEPKIAADERWKTDLTTWRNALEAELNAMPPRIRNEKELHQQQTLTLSLRIIDLGKRCEGDWTRSLETTRLGDLMRASGYVQAPPEPNTNQLFGPLPWFGSLVVVRERLQKLRAERDDAQRQIDRVLREATS